MQCDYIISDDDIKEIYDSVTSHNLESTTWGKICKDKESKNIKIDIKFNDDDLTTIPIQREFIHNTLLYNQDNNYGKVVEHMFFIIKEVYCKKGIAKSVHESELKVYKRNGFKQIQLKAFSDGVLVWNKLFYKYKDKREEKRILNQFWIYLNQVHLLRAKDIEKFKDKSLKDMQVKYLLAPDKNKDSFTEWLSKGYSSIGIEMYKDIV